MSRPLAAACGNGGGCGYAGTNFPLEWEEQDFGVLPASLMAMSDSPEKAMTEQLCRHLMSLHTLERLEPGMHVVNPTLGPLVKDEMFAACEAFVKSLPARNSSGGSAGARAHPYEVWNDIHRRRTPAEGVVQDPAAVEQRMREHGWDVIRSQQRAAKRTKDNH